MRLSRSAQCAVPKLENNVNSGRPGIAAGINTGILYPLNALLKRTSPRHYFWYKNSKRNANPKGLYCWVMSALPYR